MFKSSMRIYPLALLLILIFPGNNYSQDKVRNIVVFFSYSSNLPEYQSLLEGIKSVFFTSKSDPVNLMVEYLDLSRSDNEVYQKFIIDLYNRKTREIKIDLLITVGPEINTMLLKYRYNVMDSIPVINLDIDFPGRISLKELNVTNGIEITTKFRVKSSLTEAFALFPDYKNVYVIGGTAKMDLYFTDLVRNNISDFMPDYNFIFVPELTMDSTIQFVRKIPSKSIVIVTTYVADARKVPFSTPEVLNLISKNSSAPVFPLTSFIRHKEEGIGGYLFNFINVGKETGRIATEILNGKQVSDIVVNESDFYQYSYDYQELKRWHLTGSKAIPKDSIFYNKDTSLFLVYKWYIFGWLLFITSQTLLILYLIRLNRRQKIISERMIETENMHRELIRTDRLSKMSTMTASLSHELYQPLAAIRFTAQAAKRFIQSGNFDMVKAARMFENILEDNTRATGIIQSVRSLMKKEPIEKENVNLPGLINETVALVHAEIKRQRIEISLKFDSDHVIVFGNRIQLQQVLMNFIRNATTAMEKSDPERRLLQIILKLNKETVIVSVLDSGPGLDAAVREKLFKPFVTTKKDGFGIGLTLCKSLIENHNGKIWADSIPEGGSMFSFSLHVINTN
jgi:signal transduction histidine kinase